MSEARMEIQLGVDVADVSKNLKKFRKETKDSFQKVEKSIKPLGRAFDLLGGMVIKAGTALVAAFGVNAMKNMIRRQIDLADAAGKTAEKLGVNVEWLTKWRFAAKLAGVEAKNFETAIQRAARRLEQFRTEGTGEAVTALRLLGGGLEEAVMRGESIEELLPKIAAQLRKLEAPARILASMKLFDTEGVSVGTNLLAQSVEGLTDALRQAEQFAPIVTEEMAKSAAEANDALTRLQGTWEKFYNDVAAAFSDPAFLDFLNDISVIGIELFKRGAIPSTPRDERVRRAEERRGREFAEKNRLKNQRQVRPMTLEEIEGLEHAMGLAYNQQPAGEAAPAAGTGGGIFGPISEGLNTLTSGLVKGGAEVGAWFDGVKTKATELGDNLKEATAAMSSEYVLWVESFAVTTETVLASVKGVIDNFTAGIGDAFATAIVYGEDLGEALLATLKEAAANLISTLIQLAVQQLIYLALSTSIIAKRTAAELASWAAIVYAAAFAASASLGIVGLLAAPGVAAKYTSKMLGGAAFFGLIGKALGSAIPMAEGGIVTGPTLALLGEGGHPERVQPLDGSESKPMILEIYLDTDRIARKMVERVPGVLRVDTRIGI